MRICRNCQYANHDESLFCRQCGKSLPSISEPALQHLDQQSIRKTLYQETKDHRPSGNPKYLYWGLAVLVVIGFIMIISGVFSNIDKAKDIRSSNEAARYQKWISEELSKPYTWDLSISNTSMKVDRGYVYVTGRVKNVSTKNIGYYEISVDYTNKSGRVVGSDWTNGSDLKPNATQSFEIMTKYENDFSDYEVSIKEVR